MVASYGFLLRIVMMIGSPLAGLASGKRRPTVLTTPPDA